MSNGTREVAIVGVGQTNFGELYASRDVYRDAYALGAEALKLALEDAVTGGGTQRRGFSRAALPSWQRSS